MEDPPAYRWIDTAAEPSPSHYRRQSQQRDRSSRNPQDYQKRAHSVQLARTGTSIDSTQGWNMTSFDKGPGSGAFPSPTQARMGGLERTQPVVPAPTHRGPAAPSVMASQSQPSLPTTLESQATAGPRGGHGRNVPGLSPAFQRPEGARAGARQSVDMGAAARPQQRSSLQARASADLSRSIPGIPARISEGNEDILSTREMNIDSARKSQGDARSMADYLAQANANLEGRVEELFKMMHEVMGSENGISDVELLNVLRHVRAENMRLLRERQQVMEQNMQLLSRNSQLVEENASVLSRMVTLHQKHMQATAQAAPKPSPAEPPASRPVKRGVFGKMFGRSKSGNLAREEEAAAAQPLVDSEDMQQAIRMKEVAAAMERINADNREIMQLNQQLQNGMEQMRQENSELTNRLTEAAMRASEAESAQLEGQTPSGQHASGSSLRTDDLPPISSGSRPSSPHNGKIKRKGSSPSKTSTPVSLASRPAAEPFQAGKLETPQRSLRATPKTPFREDDLGAAAPLQAAAVPAEPGSPGAADPPTGPSRSVHGWALAIPGKEAGFRAGGSGSHNGDSLNGTPQGWSEPLTHSGSLAGPATPTKPEPLPLQATPDKALRPAEELQPHPEADLLHGERSIYQDANGFQHAPDQKGPGGLDTIAQIPEDRPLSVETRQPSMESDFPISPNSDSSTGLNTAHALMKSGGESPEVFHKKQEARHALSGLLDEVRDSRLRRESESGSLYQSASFNNFGALLSSESLRRLPDHRRCHHLVASSRSEAEPAESVPAAQDQPDFRTATVTENRGASADGSLRTLVLSVEDRVNFLDGRRVRARQEAPRWIDQYTTPGQCLVVRQPASDAATDTASSSKELVLTVSSSPYQARRQSAPLDASIVEVLVDRQGGANQQQLSHAGPGALLSVGCFQGNGFSSLFAPDIGLQSSMESGRHLLLIGVGASGIAPLRAVMDWAPVQAHASSGQVALVYLAPSPTAAAYLSEWDHWREMGAHVQVEYLDRDSSQSASDRPANPRSIMESIEAAVFDRQQGLPRKLNSSWHDWTVLLSGLEGSDAAAVCRKLSEEGLSSENILVSEQ
ncbi:hypothetical protein WJX84_008668 [Apatococcus fuscideae]|uniref:FAD-binding FR-type domain-containing protein n=1 Tax=Apatococcus fuscideae TaxID=2026836 RepID=A0AAW1SZY9_9CHLO